MHDPSRRKQQGNLHRTRCAAAARNRQGRGTDAARAVLIALDPGQKLGDHQVKERALVSVIDGTVRIEVRAQGSRASLTVEDSGPGIPEAERPLLFDRFHRAPEPGSGAGLGLAIGDSIVRSTGGRWHVGDSPLGGALMSVSWRHAQPARATVARGSPAETAR